MKTCNKCKLELSIDSFYKHSKRPDGRQVYCKGCQSVNNRKWSVENPEYETKYRMRFLYKIEPEQYAALISDGCNVCGSHEKLCVDHDHSCCPGTRTCGKCIRGVLCSDCNVAEGRLKSNLQIAKNMVTYIEKWENRNVKDERAVATRELSTAGGEQR